MIDGDSWSPAMMAGKVTRFGDSSFSKLEIKRMLLPELQTIRISCWWQVVLKYFLNAGFVQHGRKIKKALDI